MSYMNQNKKHKETLENVQYQHKKKFVLRSQGSYRVLNSSKSPEICEPVFQTWKKSEEFFVLTTETRAAGALL